MSLKRNVWVLGLLLAACQQAANLSVMSPHGATDPASSATTKKESGDSLDDLGMGDIGKTVPGPGGGSLDSTYSKDSGGSGGYLDGSSPASSDTSTSGSGTTVIAKNTDPLSSPVASSDIWCPPTTWTDTRCDKMRQMMVLKSGEAISQDPTDQLTHVRIIYWSEADVARFGLGPEEQVIQQLRAGTLGEAGKAAMIQDVVVVVREDGTGLDDVLKPGLINLVFLDVGASAATADGVGTSPSVVSTINSDHYSYVGAARLQAVESEALRNELLKGVLRSGEVR